jgi:GTPase SAR1 family protein
MSKESLCLRTFAEIIRSRMNKKSLIKTLSDDDDGATAVINGSAVFAFYSLLLESVLYVPKKNGDMDLPDVSGHMATQLKQGNDEVHAKIIEIAQRKAAVPDVSHFFAVNLIPNIPKVNLNVTLDAVDTLVQNDPAIGKTVKKKLKDARNAKTPADYLAEVFVLAVCNGKNKKLIVSASHLDSFSAEKHSKHRIWEASKRDYIASRSESSRFANLNILANLLPNGYVVHERFKEYGKTEDGDIMPLQDILNEYAANNISIIGEGGIGKTTFLLKLMESVYESGYDDKAAVPVFIELNRCPAQIGEWYSAKNQKTNFITRYMAAQMGSCELEDAPGDALTFIESEFAKTDSCANPEYVILLDGFNEVNRGKATGKNGEQTGSSIRELLNNEIKALMNRPNVRVITTSRKMDMAYFSGMTKNIELTGVKTEDIEEHLRENRYSEMDIRTIKSSHKLMDCLRIPLFLCMFTANGADDADRPSTRGEILYYFLAHIGFLTDGKIKQQ